MSGICIEKHGRKYHCSECRAKDLKRSFDYCPHCGNSVIMIWDCDTDEKIWPTDETIPSDIN